MKQQLSRLVEALQASTDPDQRARELETLLRPYGKDGAWRYAPLSERKAAERDALAAQEERAGRALYAVRAFLQAHGEEVQASIVAAREPADCEQAHEARTGKRGLGGADYPLFWLLHETRLARFERELGGAAPSAVLAQYRRALADPTLQQAASMIAWVEGKHAAGWSGPSFAAESEVGAVRELRAAINETREGRVPSELRETVAAFEAASKVAATVEALGVRPVKPEEG